MSYNLKFPLLVFSFWRLAIFLYQIFLLPYYKSTPESITLYQRLYLSWVTYWDSGHYVAIAEHGYNFPQQAFFPLWPLVIKIFSFVFGFYTASFLLSFILGLTTFVLFYFLAVRLIGKSPARYALILFAAFPSTMFLHAGYTEGLFLTLTLLSFLMLEKKLYLPSAIFAGLTTMTRLAGVGITAAYLILKQPFLKKIIYMLISVSGLLFYILFLQIIFGNGFLFIDAQKSWCQSAGHCQLRFPLTMIFEYGRLVLMGWIRPSLSFAFIDWSSSVTFLALLFIVWRRLNKIYFVYSLLVIILPLMSGSMVGMVRYVLVAFPVFFVAPLVIRSKILLIIICILLLLLELRLITFFTNRMWVA